MKLAKDWFNTDGRIKTLSQSTVTGKPEGRDRLLFISAIVIALLTILGAAGESIGFDRKLKVNTVKTRTHSLLNQGIYYYNCFNNVEAREQDQLLTVFNELLVTQNDWAELLLSI